MTTGAHSDPRVSRSSEAIQREHELNRAIEAARTLQERLEMLGDRDVDVEVVHSLRDSLARDLSQVPHPLVDLIEGAR